MRNEGIFSDTGALIEGPYRYVLWREWDPEQPRVLWILLNPSTATATEEDPTLRRLIAFSRSWNYGSLAVVNLFSLRATQPSELARAVDPIGPKTDEHIRRAISGAGQIVLGWGALGNLRGRDLTLFELLQQANRTACCLGFTSQGAPRHPLYIRREAPLVPYPVTYGLDARPQH
jgi:hypothetical protein